MSEKDDEKTRTRPHRDGYAGSLTTQQLRAVGQRRREAEVKLEHQLEEARHKDDSRDDKAVNEEETGAVNSHEVAAIQNHGRLTAWI